MRTLSYYDTDIFIVCYTVDDKDSLDNVRTKWVPEISEFRPNTPFILVGTQTDLRGSLVDITESCITTQQGRKMARKLGAEGFFECSALDGVGIFEVFQSALEVIGTTRSTKLPAWKSFRKLFRRKSMKT